ncbi:monocarboxylate transporter 7-like [Lampris incognitus]|uniref:monocarboxylate transporter 7-like n=1 Tax=Lampris incognitus TaxID=2546036 RepID=UPI0024B4D31D|nr:monocarboxylate transporter 7-like [Lampris incognitus]
MVVCVLGGKSLLGPNVYPEVPDGGWGWLVAVAFFLVEVFTYGTIKSFGIFLQDLMEEFGETNSRVSWIISICVFVMTFTAPLSSVMTNRFGFQPVVMTGGLLIAMGTITTGFAKSINEMYITTGIVSGLGYCLTFLPTVTILSQYFSHRRSLVTAVASTGESFSMFALAPAFSALRDRVGWSYTMVVIGALQGLIIVCGSLLRPIVIKPQRSHMTETEGLKKDGALHQNSPQVHSDSFPPKTSCSQDEELARGDSLNSGDSGVQSMKDVDETSKVETSSLHVNIRLEVLQKWMEEDKVTRKEEKKSADEEKGGSHEEKMARGDKAASIEKPKLLDFSILRESSFICYSLFGLFATLGFFAPQLYVVELSVSRGMDRDHATYMLSIMAVAEVFGRLCIGWVLCRRRLRKRKPLVLLACVASLTVVLVAFTLVWEFYGLAVCCGFYGFFMGTIACSHIPMLAEEDVVGIERMASAAGVYVFIQSFAGLAGPPLGGVLVDVTQNYGSAFYSCALGMGLGAVFLGLVKPAKKGLISWRRDEKSSEDVHVVKENSLEKKEVQEHDKGRESPKDYLEVDSELNQDQELVTENGQTVIIYNSDEKLRC